MSLISDDRVQIPAETERIAKASFPKGTPLLNCNVVKIVCLPGLEIPRVCGVPITVHRLVLVSLLTFMLDMPLHIACMVLLPYYHCFYCGYGLTGW